MKKTLRNHFLTLAGIFLLCIMMGCSTKETETSEESPEPTTEEELNEATLEPTAEGETQQDKLSELPQSIQDIYYGDGEFYDVSRKQIYTKETYQVHLWEKKDNSKQTVHWLEYIVVDLDKDGEKEWIVELKNKDSVEDIRVFDSQQDKVYCYSYSYRAILHVYEDGVILGSSGASNHTWYSLTFKKEKAEETIIVSQEDTKVYINGKKVSGKKYNEFLEKNYSDDKEIQWIPFQS